MVRKLTFIIISLLYAASCAGAIDYDSFYRRWKAVPMEELSDMGERYLAENKLDSATAFFSLVKNIRPEKLDTPSLKALIRAENCLGIISFMNSDYTNAYASFRRAQELDTVPDAGANINLAALYHYFGDRRQSILLLSRVLESAVKNRNVTNASLALQNIMTSAFTVDNPEEIAAYSRKMRLFLKNFKDADGEAVPFTRRLAQAMLLAADKNYTHAAHSLKSTLSLANKLLVPDRNIISVHLALGTCMLQAGKPDSAIFYYNKARTLAGRDNYPELTIEAYHNLSEAYRAKGDTENEKWYELRHLQMKDSLFNIGEFGKLRDFQAAYDRDKFETEISRLAAEDQFKTRIILIISGASLIIVVALLLLLRQHHKLRRKNRDLFDRNMEVLRQSENRGQNTSLMKEDIPPHSESKEQKDKYAGSSLNPDIRLRLRKQIENVLEDEQAICSVDFSLDRMAELVGSNVRYVSQVLNEDFGKNFSRIINERRIAIVCRRFLDAENYGQYTIEAIIADIGFKSRSTFSKTFKLITGLTPSEFIRQAREKRS